MKAKQGAVSGPFAVLVKREGPFAVPFQREGYPVSWYYRSASGAVDLHIQDIGPQGLMHLIIAIPARDRKRK